MDVTTIKWFQNDKEIDFNDINPNEYWSKHEYDQRGNVIYFEDSEGYWDKQEYNQNGKYLYRENSDGEWVKYEYDKDGDEIYYEDSTGYTKNYKPKPKSNKVVGVSVSKCTEEELDNVREYLRELDEVIKENNCYNEDDPDVNKQIADVARKYPNRAFIVPLNLGVLLDNYQDKDSEILEHPKWITDMVNTLKEVNQCLLTNTTIDNTLQNKIKSCLLDDENGNN